MGAGGRPTKYNQELQDKADWYAGEGWKEVGDAVPTVEGLALELGVTPRTLQLWANDEDKQILRTLADIHASQSRNLINHGLFGTYNSNIVKLMMANHGYRAEPKETVEETPQEAINVGVSDAS